MAETVEEARARHERVMELFDALCDLGADERGLELALLRERDPRVAAEVEGLLGHDAPGGLDGGKVALLAADAASSSRGSPRRLIGQAVGRYRVEELLGGGGFGTVYRARGPDGDVAIKLLRADLGDRRAEQRFRREFLAVARLDHPGVVRVLEEGVHEEDRYIAMEFVPGGDLMRLAGAPPSRLLPALARLCDALAYVHGRGVVHRDLKPANVLLTRDEQPWPRLADFGIAKVSGEGLSSLSSRGKLVGTIDFLSPEQVLGQPVDARSDLYALGVMIHELWSGRLPFEGTPFERLAARVDRDAPPLRAAAPGAPPALEALVARLLARAPKERPPSAAEVRDALAALELNGQRAGA
jgi:serine/threonine protein kinase